MTNQKIYIGIGAVLLFLLFVAGIWFLFFRPAGSLSTNTSAQNSFFGQPPANTTTSGTVASSNGTQTINTTVAAAQKIFEITAGPVVGATLLQTLHPTTTIARYISQEDGHVYDVPLGVAGAVPTVVSDVTIPGGQRAIWLQGGSAALLQYVDSASNIKTIYLGFTVSSTSAVLPTKIEFLPDNIIDVAASPDGQSVVYLLKTASGSDGYIANADGTDSKKVFSLPLSQLLVSWPSQETILLQTTSAAGVTGMAFAADVKTDTVSTLFLAEGLSATANPTFSEVVYEKSDGTDALTYVHSIKNGANNLLSFSPIPEKCIWSALNTSNLYCATPLEYVGPNYLDLWHQGVENAPDALFSYNLANGASAVIATPGSNDGGSQADILEMALSPDEHYLSYTTKGDRSLWGVLLAQ